MVLRLKEKTKQFLIECLHCWITRDLLTSFLKTLFSFCIQYLTSTYFGIVVYFRFALYFIFQIGLSISPIKMTKKDVSKKPDCMKGLEIKICIE